MLINMKCQKNISQHVTTSDMLKAADVDQDVNSDNHRNRWISYIHRNIAL